MTGSEKYIYVKSKLAEIYNQIDTVGLVGKPASVFDLVVFLEDLIIKVNKCDMPTKMEFVKCNGIALMLKNNVLPKKVNYET